MQLRNCLKAHLKIHEAAEHDLAGGEGVAVELSVEMHFRLVAIIQNFWGKMSAQFCQKVKLMQIIKHIAQHLPQRSSEHPQDQI